MKICDILSEFKELPQAGENPEVLTLTEKNGFVRQSDRFSKRLATEDLSKYKLIHRDDFAFNPYLLWAGAIARNDRFDEGVISPLYPTFKANADHDPAYIQYFLLSPPMLAKYDNIAFGSVPRRRRSSVKDFLNLSIPNLPPLTEQQRIADILETSAEIIHKEEHLQRSILPLAVNVVERKVAPSDSTLGNLIESMSSGKNVAESPDPNQKNRVLKVSAVTSGTFKPTESKPLPDTYLPPKAHQVRKGDILVSRANTTELLGASALVENDVESLYLPDKIWRVTPKDGVDPYLLWGILQTKTVRARISQRATGSSGSMKNISQRNFLQVPCATFSRSESAKLAALIREAVSVYHQIAQNLTLLRSLHHSLSTRAFAGQL